MRRPIAAVHLTSDFQKSFRRLPKNIRRLAEKKDRWFRSDAFDPRLETHKLKGELAGYWAYSVNYQHRILFAFLGSDEVIYYDVGTHEIYR
jgi:mRNA-degrading endonuclease YafQ of YafQ-DinJ toxin-antitoxin module